MTIPRTTRLLLTAALAAAAAGAGCSALRSNPGELAVDEHGAAPGTALLTGIGVVEDYRPAARETDQTDTKYFRVAYWVNLRAANAAPGNQGVVLYVDVGRTEYEPELDRYLLRGCRLKYSGLPTPAHGAQPAHIDTSVAGGRLDVVLSAVPAAKLADCVVGKRVAFEGLVEPRQPWMKKFPGQEGQTWKLIVTLPSGETVDIADLWLVESKGFQTTLKLMRAQRAVRVRVVGEVRAAASYKSEKRPGTPRDVRGSVLVAVDELRILGDEPGQVKP